MKARIFTSGPVTGGMAQHQDTNDAKVSVETADSSSTTSPWNGSWDSGAAGFAAEPAASLWQENNGNFLVMFAVGIFVLGSGVLACRQLRFVPPRFPDGRAIQPPEDSLIPIPESGVESVDDLGTTGDEADVDSDGLVGAIQPVIQTSLQRPMPAAVSKAKSTKVSSGASSYRIIARGAAADRGNMMLAVYDSPDGFNDPASAIYRDKVQVRDGGATFQLPAAKLPRRFAVAVYHDENADSRLNRNLWGIPTERYGFSNDARSLTGPPSFDQAVVQKSDHSDRLVIAIR
ncbi:DUF2141 domain-containing protein [Crateriforma conspicua]|nr:DUF2141 domain-containing protein [Crateriforma conspicua]